MGWESISMGLNAQGEVLNNSYWTSAPEDGAMLWPQFAEGNISGSMTLYASELQYGDSTNGLVYDDNGHTLYVYYNGQQVAYFGLNAYDEWISYLIFFGIDEENQVGSIWIAERRMTDRWGYTIAGGRVLAGSTTQIYNTNLAYNIIKRIMPLVGATIKVNYYLPNDEYTYAKITYKQNTSPIDQNDGDSVDIDPTLSSVNIEGLEEEKTYWFTIFTNKSESEAVQYTVGPITDPVPPEYKEKCIKIGSTQIGNESTREFYNSEYKLYSGTAIYDTIYNYSRKATYISRSNTVHFDGDRSQQATRFWIADDIVTISFDTTTNTATYSSINVNKNFYTSNNVNFAWFYCAYSSTSNCYTGSFTQAQTSGYNTKPSFGPSSFATFFENGIGEFIDYIYKRFRNVNLYVDGVQWVVGSLN